MMPKQSKPVHAGAPVITDEVRKVSELTADPRNARRHSEAQISQIVASIERFGFVEKIAIRPDGQIIAGHARVEALKRLGPNVATPGPAEVEVRVVAGLSEAAYKALGLALNKIPENSQWDDDILRDILGELQNEGEDAIGLGFSPNELNKLMAEPDDIEVKEIETGPVDDEFWISVRGPLKDQAHALKALQEAMKPYSGVTVEQGTISLG
jgi:ParB-like chromosome segregation protein Spo0J